MTEFSEDKITAGLCKRSLLCALVLYLSVAQGFSAPHDQSALCEAQYEQCIKRITEAFTKNKILCESSFRRCQTGKQR